MKIAFQSIQQPTILTIFSLVIFGCQKNNSTGTPDSASPVSESKTQLEIKDQESKKVFQRGGQPGLITLSGILVSEDLKLNSHVESILEGGFGKDGSEASVDKKASMNLSSQSDVVAIPAELRTLITLGCDQSFEADLAKKRSLTVEKNLSVGTEQKILLRAKTVVLCGKIEDLQTPSFSIEADELILNSADITQIGISGSMSFAANKLFLFGSNIITTQGSDANLIFFSAPALTLRVTQQLIADDSARLLVVSKGSSYAEK